MGQLGDMLYDARRTAAVSLAEIATVTRIRASVLEDLEAGNYGSLPDPGYLRGFVSDYVRYLGKDPEPFLHQLEVETGRPRVNARTNSARRPQRAKNPEVSTRKRPHEVQWKPLITWLVILAVVGLVAWLGYSLWPKGSDVTPTPTDTGSQNTTDTAKPAVGAPFTLTVKAVDGGASDVVLVVDAVPMIDQTISSADDPIQVDVVSSAEITLSNPSKIQVFINGTAVPIGAANEPVTLTAPTEDQ